MNFGRESLVFRGIIVVVLMVTTHDKADIGPIAVVVTDTVPRRRPE